MKTLTKTLKVMLLSGICAVSLASEHHHMSTLNAGKFVPPDDKLLLFIGQDSGTIDQYQRAMPEDPLEGVTLYTTLKHGDPTQTLRGVFSRANWQSGDMDFAYTLTHAKDAALAVGLATDECDGSAHSAKISAGDYQQSLLTLLNYFKQLAPRKVFLRIGYEFDGPWNCYQPETYKAAFRHIANTIKRIKADNIATVWQSATWPDPSIAGQHQALYDHRNPEHLHTWYPGDDVVDWVGMSVFYRDLSQWSYEPPDTPQRAQAALLDFARAQHKPVMIAEAAPQGYRIAAQTHSFITLNKQTPRSADIIWQDWYAKLFDFIAQNRDVIRALAYINTHWDAQPRWQCADNSGPPAADCSDGNWGDSRVQANPVIRQRWLQQVSDDTRWIQDANY